MREKRGGGGAKPLEELNLDEYVCSIVVFQYTPSILSWYMCQIKHTSHLPIRRILASHKVRLECLIC